MIKAENFPKIIKNPRNFPKKPKISGKIPKQVFTNIQKFWLKTISLQCAAVIIYNKGS